MNFCDHQSPQMLPRPPKLKNYGQTLL
uniref:Uncharacterized protein n=1 Tax=Anguilla anguilla TaxID=7936 RepID=A0A0E9SKZ9_ANGAN